MATGQYIGVGGVARKVTNPYIGVEGVARKVTAGYVGVEGVARQFFTAEVGVPVVLEVAKKTATTYSGSTSYADESFILLDIYPKNASSKVNVTYGGLTKTLTFSGTNAQQVYFGTFNGVTDSVDTTDSGTLTIEGGCIGFACGAYQNGSKTTNKGYCGCITAVTDWGSITELQDYMFRGCTGLTSVSFPDSITSIAYSAFYDCSALALSELPSGITSIESYAFSGCTNLALTTLPSSITSIGDYAFSNCSALTNVELPSSITSIGDYAFSNCRSINSVNIPASLTTIGVNPWYNSGHYSEANTSPGYITISVDVKNNCFKVEGNCLIEISTNTVVTGLAKATIPSYITIIGESAFRSIARDEVLVLPNGVTDIRYCAFFNFYVISTIPGHEEFTLPSTVKTIDSQGLDFRMGTITKLICLGETPPSLESSSISSSVKVITVPAGCGDTYKTAGNWSYYADHIVEAS